MIWFIGCEDVTTTTNDEPEQTVQTFPEMASLEQTLSDFAELLPEALTDPGLAKIVWNEAKANEQDEPYALWSRIADVPTPSGVTLRSKIQDIKLKRSRGKVSVGAQSFTSSLDDVEYLQVYIHDFEDWDSTSTLPTTFTPLTINDIDVTELTLYDSLGNTTVLEVDTIPPAYPIAVVGLNEGMAMEGEFGSNNRMGSLGKTTVEQTVRITKIKLKKSAWRYEPWFYGKNAEVYFVQHVPDEQDKLESVIANLASCFNNFSGSINDSISTFQGIKVTLEWLFCSLKASPEEWWNVSLGERTNYHRFSFRQSINKCFRKSR
jgi:hypothetical protein